MLVLFDQSTPAPLRDQLTGHSVTEARDRGWDRLANGDLLNAAEAAGFEGFVTADKNLRYQQNLTERKLAIVVMSQATRSGGSYGFTLSGSMAPRRAASSV
jgi:hypothetical protein